jgi:hypothetical protein
VPRRGTAYRHHKVQLTEITRCSTLDSCPDVVDLTSNVNVVDNLELSSPLDPDEGLKIPICKKGHEKIRN